MTASERVMHHCGGELGADGRCTECRMTWLGVWKDDLFPGCEAPPESADSAALILLDLARERDKARAKVEQLRAVVAAARGGRAVEAVHSGVRRG